MDLSLQDCKSESDSAQIGARLSGGWLVCSKFRNSMRLAANRKFEPTTPLRLRFKLTTTGCTLCGAPKGVRRSGKRGRQKISQNFRKYSSFPNSKTFLWGYA